MDLPIWLADRLAAAATPRDATRGLLFHGTVEPFETPLRATGWERLLWFAEAPEIAQSYCPESGSEVLKSFASHALDDRFVPHGDFDARVFAAMGFDVAAMKAERDLSGRMTSYRVLPGHPSNRDARAFLEGLGYRFDGESAWIKVRLLQGGGDELMPASWMTPGRLFVAERPAGLRLYDLATTEEGGLSGRQWMRTDLFQSLAESGEWDGLVIDDVHRTRRLGHFGHRSIGLFQATIDRLRLHATPCVHCDPYEVWNARDGSTTSEFDGLHEEVLAARYRAAA
jgi:hypothetical protein